ncbi:MAG TPA: hypothetical protein DEF51_10845 [Myxococcales bacterium]|nr:hypothetical protein [Myxococcales bacterium]
MTKGSKSCLIYLIGEGPHDIGWLADAPEWRPQASGRSVVPSTGFLPPVLKRIASEYGIEVRFDGRKLTSLAAGGRALTAGDALTRKAKQAVALAQRSGAHAIVFVHDVDKQQAARNSAVERQRQMARVRERIRAGLSGSEIPVLIATPSRMLEAWVLGDPRAIREHAAAGAPPAPANPETLWGAKRDPTSDYPKHVLKRCLGAPYDADLLMRIAEISNLEAMGQSCPESFGPFLSASRELAEACADADQ